MQNRNSLYYFTSVRELEKKSQFNEISSIKMNSLLNVRYLKGQNKMSERFEKPGERIKLMRKSATKTDKEIKETEKIWKQREIDSRREDTNQVVKRNELDTLVAITLIIILFTIVFFLAPNQHYIPKK